MRQFFFRWWFLLGLIAVIAAGMGAPAACKSAAESVPNSFVVASVLFVMALPLDIRAMWRIASRPLAPGLAVAVNMLLLPLMAFSVAKILPLNAELATGLIVCATVPCTLASAAVWTRRAGGNEAIALFVTVITNLICFLVTPAWLAVLTAHRVQAEGTLDFTTMTTKLALLVVVPMVLAQLLRLMRSAAKFAAEYKIWLGVYAQLGILSIVFVGGVTSGLELQASDSASLSSADWALMIAAVLAVHLAALWIGYRAALAIGLPREDASAVGIAGSQKTLMVGLLIALDYGGLTMLPLVTYHVGQLIVDTLIADRWRRPQTRSS